MSNRKALKALRVLLIVDINNTPGPQHIRDMSINIIHQLDDDQLEAFALSHTEKHYPALFGECSLEHEERERDSNRAAIGIDH
jgi:hypothetical protein